MERPVSILIVDDDPRNLTALEAVIAEPGVQVVCASSGREAVIRVQEHEVAAVVLDIRMPSMDGYETVAAIRDAVPAPGPPILLVTAHAPDHAETLRGYSCGVADVLYKPIHPKVLRSKINTFVDLHRKTLRLRQLERVRADARVAEQHEAAEVYRHGILDTALDGIIIAGPDGTVLEFNPAAEAMFAVARADVVGRKLADRFVPSTVVRGRLEVDAHRADGSAFPVELSVSRIPSPDGMLLAAFVRDISQRKQLQHQLVHAQKMEAVGRLAAGLAHDFNNLLTVILGGVDILAHSLPEEHTGRDVVEDVHEAARRARDITEKLHAFSRRRIVEARAVDLNGIVIETSKMLRRLLPDRVQVTQRLSADRLAVLADPSWLEQILTNLIINACDAMPAGGDITVETRDAVVEPGEREASNTELAAGRYAILAVRDTGTGMDATTLAHLFEPYYTTKQPGAGTGLGLATSYAMIRQMDGRIAVDSAPRRGTTVTVWLPQCQAVEPSSVAQPVAPAGGGTETVLIVERSAAILRVAATMLRARGYQVVPATNPEEALALSASHPGPLHLVICGATRPAMAAPVLVARLTSSRPELRVLYICEHEPGLAEDRALDPADVVRKPFTTSALAGAVRRALDRP